MSPRRPSGSFYRPELDSLRFFAFLAVFVDHTLLLDPGRGQWWKRLLGGIGASGAFGVDLFFALSAYLITELLLRERESTGTLGVRAFYLRRILRIWPLYFAFLLFTVLLPGDGMTPSYAAGFALFCGNWLSIAHPVQTLAAPLWSVSVEEQFYLIWPWAVRRGDTRRIAVIAVCMAVASVACCVALEAAGIGEPWISKNSLCRAQGIAAGVLLAVVLDGQVPQLSSVKRWSIIGAALVLLAALGNLDPFAAGVHLMRATLVYPAVALLCAGILFAVLGAEGALGTFMRHPALVYLGRISYGLYVFHQVGIAVANRVFPDHLRVVRQWPLHFALSLLVTLAFSAASYRFLEQPFLRLKRRRYTVVESRPDAPEPAIPVLVPDAPRA
jgi:peptidoglycan/LPS O-acetylase OafA/YrhL